MHLIITVGGKKGGTGKSTVATNLAVWLAQQDLKFILLDADRTKTSNSWTARRNSLRENDPSVLRVTCVDKLGRDIAQTAVDLEQDYGIVVIDSGGHDSVELRGALACSDWLYTPVAPSQFDVEALSGLAELVYDIQSALNPSLKTKVVLTQVDSSRGRDEFQFAKDAVAEFASQTNFEVSSNYISALKAYRKAAMEGRGVTELRNSTAKAEIQLLGQEIFG
jgi:chromosome partitioning protein